MAIVGTSYSDWMRQNPGIVDQATQRQQQQANAQAVAPPAPSVQAVPTQVQPVAQPVAQQPQATVQPVNAAPSSAQAGGVNGAVGLGPINTPTDTGDKGYDGVKNVAKMIASFYTGGFAGGAQTVATSGKSGGSNGADAQTGDDSAGKAAGIMGMISKFGGG